ncbi:hypothetical protein NC652_025088 [Populus alba x Populus x berolinensis]|nr:hypothetical protein NC652_025088 [Populus alba x Populus x berolinensis]
MTENSRQKTLEFMTLDESVGRVPGVEGLMVGCLVGISGERCAGCVIIGEGLYTELLEMAKRHGLTGSSCLCRFNQCGGNVGDSCTFLDSLALEESTFFFFLFSVDMNKNYHPMSIGIGETEEGIPLPKWAVEEIDKDQGHSIH